VLNEVIENLGLNFDYETLSSKLKITNPSDSRILELDVTDSDPYLAKRIVDEIAAVSSKYIGEKMEVTTPNIIEEGVIPYRSTSPSMRKNVLLGLMLGLLLGCAIVTVEELMNDAIVTEEDVEQYLGLYTLAVLPDKEQKKNGVQRKLQKFMKKRAAKKA
jgi:capsular polysaccharide biosynthesis protein